MKNQMSSKLLLVLGLLWGLVLGEFNGESCFMLDYITMHRAQIKDKELTDSVFQFPNQDSPTRTIFTFCKDVGSEFKARCGVGSEANVTMIFLVDDACVAYRRYDQIVTSHIYKDSNQLTLDILYPKKREQMEKEEEEEFDLVTIRFDLKETEERSPSYSLSKEPKSYNALLKDYSLSGYIYTVHIPNRKNNIISSTKKNFISHTNLNPVETALSWSMHSFFAYGMLYHNHQTKNLLGLRPFNLYLVYFVPMRVIGWIDAALYQATEKYRSEFDWLITSVYIFSPFVLGYFFEWDAESKKTQVWLLPIYFFINFADFIIINMFLSQYIGLLCVVFYAFVFFLPQFCHILKDPKEWRVSQAVCVEFFMQHVLWLPFKKIGALKFYLNGLQAYYISEGMLMFAIIMILFHVPVCYFRYQLSALRSEQVREDREDFKMTTGRLYKSMAEYTYHD